jgi:hypothetical protein
MFDRKPAPPSGPTLLDRVVKSQSRRVAVLGLHPGAGARTVLSALVRDVHARQWPMAVLSSPGLPLEPDEVAIRRSVIRVAMPEGAWLATAEATVAESTAELERNETTPWETLLGPIGVYRVARAGEVSLHGPTEPEATRELVSRLSDRSGGLVFVEGGWERRAFAAPGTCDGIVLAVAAGYSASPERSAAAVRYLVETLSVPPCNEASRSAWQETASKGAAALLDAGGRMGGVLPPGLEDPVPALRTPDGGSVATVVLPFGLNDEFMIPLVRSQMRCTLVVRDATRLNVSPVYFKAWLKGGGRIHVVHSTKLVGLATSPFNPSGPDADPDEFRMAVATALPELPVHDVVIEAPEEPRKSLWKFWE